MIIYLGTAENYMNTSSPLKNKFAIFSLILSGLDKIDVIIMAASA